MGVYKAWSEGARGWMKKGMTRAMWLIQSWHGRRLLPFTVILSENHTQQFAAFMSMFPFQALVLIF